MSQMQIQICLALSLKWDVHYWNILENNQCRGVKDTLQFLIEGP